MAIADTRERLACLIEDKLGWCAKLGDILRESTMC